MLKAYEAFLDKQKNIKLDMDVARNDWYQYPDGLSMDWLIHNQMLTEHAIELANSLNEMKRYIINLKAWSEVLDDLETDKEKGPVIIEFVSPLATLAINLPYVIRSRFFYSIAHLCHQANQIKQSPWSDDLPIDTEIYQEQADIYGRPWEKRYGKLKCALEKCCNKKYQADTLDFRNKYNHRYSPRIEIGLTSLVTRKVDGNGRVSYGFGGVKPIKLKEILPLLVEQHSGLMKAFYLYQELVNEQIRLIETDHQE